MPNLAEHEIFSTNKYENANNIFSANKYENANNSWHFFIFISREKFHAQLCLARKNLQLLVI